MSYNDELVLIIDRFTKTENTYIAVVGLKFTNEKDFLEMQSKHSFIQDQLESVLNDINNFKPSEVTDLRKPIFQEHINQYVKQHANILSVFEEEYSFEMLEKYNVEVMKMNGILDSLMKDLAQK
ncbi:hypothetical protein LAV73_13830 [Lysinibacillus xylanilyticus]|uniref:hypothetical protein n=1 Tax=Lysinibacillus xylanilyticus TaxID=582475 RepID=UPI002B250693|nr:hypothetical protein [Lysinibacillus xylanilyticus]MEB2281068.1 hypothetical protein [Lysinibacillus xylanilyticus]